MKKRTIIISFLLSILLLASCGMEGVLPEESDVISKFATNRDLYLHCKEFLEETPYDALISRGDYYAPASDKAVTGLYIQNMEDDSVSLLDDDAVKALIDQGGVKLIDSIRRDELFICTFDLCIPGKDYDYGFYYTSGEEPIYFGDPTMKLIDSGEGVFRFDMKSSYGIKFSYLTKQIDDHFYYYEIS